MTTDLTTGRVSSVILRFSLPLLLSTVLQQFYNIADSIIVGRFTGAAGLAAIGAAYPITLFFVAVTTGASMGCSVVISRIFGAGERHTLWRAAFTAMLSFFALGLLISLAGVVFSGALMRLINAQDEIFDEARLYLAIYAAGVCPMMVYNAANGISTGLGDAKLPLYLLIISSVLNVILDYIAVRFLQWGVAGAAIATSVSQLAAAVLAAVILLRRVRRISEGGTGVFDCAVLREIAASAVPCMLQQSSVALGHTVVQSILNTYSTAIIAGYEAASKFHNFAYMGMNTIGSAFASFAAQCRGAGKQGRIREGFRMTVCICLGIALAIVAIYQSLPRQMIGLFIDADSAPEVIGAGVNYLRIISPVYVLISFIVAAGGLLRGMERSLAFFIETVLELGIRVVMCYVLTAALASYTGLLWAWYFGSGSGFLMCLALSAQTLRRSKHMESR